MSDLRPGPYDVEETTVSYKLEGPTLRIRAGDGSVVLAASTNAGGRSARAEIEAAVDLCVEALNGGKPAKKTKKTSDKDRYE